MADGHAIKLRLDNERLMRVNLDLEARITTLEAQLAAADAMVSIYDGLPDPNEMKANFAEYVTASAKFAEAMATYRTARAAAKQIDKEPNNAK